MLLVGVFAIAGWFFQGFGPAPQPAPIINTTTTVNLVAPPMEPEAVAETTVVSSQAMVVQVAAPVPIELAKDMLAWPDIWRTTPPELTYQQPQVVRMEGLIRGIALGLLALFLFAHAIGHTLGQGSDYPQIMYAFIKAAGNLLWWEIGIRLNNLIAEAIGAPSVEGLIQPFLIVPEFNPGDSIKSAVLVIVYSVVAILMMVNLVFRLGLIDILIVVGPIAHMCASIEQTASWSSTYDRMSAGLLFSQILTNVGFALAGAFGAIAGGNIIMAIIVLLLVRRLPALVSSTGNSAPSRGMGALFGALVLRRMRLR